MATKIGNIWPGEGYALLGCDGAIINKWQINPTASKIPVYNEYDPNSYSFEAINFYNSYWRWGAINGNGTIRLSEAGSSVTINGNTYTELSLRRSEEVYFPNGTYSHTLPAGTTIAIGSGSCGSTKTYLLAFYYYYSNGQWLSAVSSGYGFVDTGAREYGCDSNWSIIHNYN